MSLENLKTRLCIQIGTRGLKRSIQKGMRGLKGSENANEFLCKAAGSKQRL